MASLMHATEAGEAAPWEITKDAFVPPPTRRLVRGWDRAPVAAHAPRLHGQKVWKKVGLRSMNCEDIKDGEVQEELLKEGVGARKKSRMTGTRENIGNAIWVDTIHEVCANKLQTTHDMKSQAELQTTPELPTTTTSPKSDTDNSHLRGEAMPPSLYDIFTSACQFIPRKRTNTNHVITPRKPLRQMTLNRQAQADPLTFTVEEEVKVTVAKVSRPRKSLRKSNSAKMADGMVERRSSRAHTARTTSNAELSSDASNTSLHVEDPETSVSAERKMRTPRRKSTITATRSTVNTELPASKDDKGEQNTGKGKDEGIGISPPEPAEPILLEEGITPVTSVEPPKPLIKKGLDNKISTDPMSQTEISNESEPSREEVTETSTSVMKLSTNDENPILDASTEKDTVELGVVISTPNTPMPNKLDAGLEIQDVHSPVRVLVVEVHDAEDGEPEETPSNAVISDEEPVPGFLVVGSPVKAESSSSAASGNEAAQLEVDDALDVTAEAEEGPQDAQDIEETSLSDSINGAAEDSTSANTTVPNYDHDDTDMLRNFLTRVKANKAAKNPPKRKRSLPHSPLRIPLGDVDSNLSPSPQRPAGEADLTSPSPSRRKRIKNSALSQVEDSTEPSSCRRSNRTRIPVKEPPGAPSFIPVRRFGQDADNATVTVTLKRNEDKELAALTRVNTRKNKGNAQTAAEVLAKKSEEKEDPAMRQRLLKEVFEEKAERGKQASDKDRKSREKKKVKWAEELAQFQMLTGSTTVVGAATKGKGKGKATAGASGEEKEANMDKEKVLLAALEEKKQQHGAAVRVGVRSKAALGMVLNGTPAPKRKMRGRA